MATNKRKESRLPIPGITDWNPAEPVSSTLAANLVPHLSSQGDGTPGLTREAFSQLRHELVEGRYSQLQLNDSISDVKKLVCIVLKAGLEPCIRDNRSELQGQLLDCLDIVQNAVDKAPLALLEVPDPEVLGRDAPIPLYSCLVVWLVHLFSTWDNERVEHRIDGILSSISNASHNNTRLWPLFVGITAFLQACTTELIDAIEAYQSRARVTHVASSLVVNPNQPCTLDLDRLDLRCGYFKRSIRLQSYDQAVRLCLSMLTSAIGAYASSNIPSKRQNLTWLANGYRRLWKLSVVWHCKSGAADIASKMQTFSQFLGFIKRFCDHVSYMSPKPQLAYNFLQTFAETLALDSLKQATDLQRNLSHAIDSFTNAFTSEENLMRAMRATMLHVKSNLALFNSLETCLQAAIESSLISCSLLYKSRIAKGAEAAVCTGDISESLAVHEIPGFSQPSNGVGAVCMAKRRCLPELDADRENQNVAQKLIAESLKLLRCDQPGTLGDLSCAVPHLMTSFVRKDLHHETRRSNFIVILDWLQNLSEKQETPLHETCILTLCHLAQFSNDEEMNIILLRLVEYLGHPNPFIGAVAYTELSGLAQHLSVTPAALFRPFWRTLSVTVVRNFQSRPYMAEQLCDLLGMKVDDFLRLTETYVLPYLVLTRKREVIIRVGAAYKDTKTPFDICSEKNNLASILAFLLSQPSPNPEESVMSALSEVDAAFSGRSLAELLRIEPILISCDLLKGLGDLGEDKGKRVSHFQCHNAVDAERKEL
ncbi:serine/threonine-protein kinase M1 [Aspergillus brasiliensis]|nr:serine/threonine-protein kinase M1 [Aspergillus brasiliensis]